MESHESWTYGRKAYEAKYREANREKIRENKRRWRERQKLLKQTANNVPRDLTEQKYVPH